MPDLIADAVTVRSPATSANLGPGFDSFGLALARFDTLTARVIPSGLDVTVEGEGAEGVGLDETHLVVRSMRAAFDLVGAAQPGIALSCSNQIPHGRGLGSSSAAIVAGIKLADGLLGAGAISAEVALILANEIEGHPDNVAACIYGGMTIAWLEDGTARAARLDVVSGIHAVAFVPPTPLSTHAARGLLPTTISHDAAAANAGRAALLVAAMTGQPDLLLAATEDSLHQEFRRSAMPDSFALIDTLRAAGYASFVSGAGPTVLTLVSGGRDLADDHPLIASRPSGWDVFRLGIEAAGVRLQDRGE